MSMATRMAADRATEPVTTLAGYHVLVTRPAARAGDLCAQLAAAAATVYAAPLLAIETLPESPQLRAIAQQLDRFDIVIVTSRHAVAAAMPLLTDFWPQWPVAQRWLAVGAGTAAALVVHGVRADAPADARSEGLLAMPVLRAVNGLHILLIAGEGGRDALERTLAERGAVITRMATYRRVAVSDGARAIDAFRHTRAAPGRRIALVTSNEALQNLLALAPWLPGSDVVAIVASERIAASARAAGIAHVIDAHGADDEQQRFALLTHAANLHSDGESP